jgi:hypothetical protein
VDYRSLKIVEAFPLARFAPEGGEVLFRRMRGATIVQIGSTDEDGIEGGGLLIDYVPANGTTPYRIVFAFNELGLWTVWEGPTPTLEIASK